MIWKLCQVSFETAGQQRRKSLFQSRPLDQQASHGNCAWRSQPIVSDPVETSANCVEPGLLSRRSIVSTYLTGESTPSFDLLWGVQWE